MNRCYKCEPLSDAELLEWQEHGMFNAYRYGIDEADTATATKPTQEEVMEFLEWAKSWSDCGVPG